MDVIVICTLNRPYEVEFLLTYLRRQIGWTGEIVVVDASADGEVREALAKAAGAEMATLLPSLPGLPLQRNIALTFIRQAFSADTVVHFIDDDVIPSSSYFSAAANQIRLGLDERPSVVGSRDLLLRTNRRGEMLRTLRLKGKDGRISSFGLSSPPQTNSHLNQWSPGHGISLQPSQFEAFEFDSSINFFGEDMEATLRLGVLGDIRLTSDSVLLHVPGLRKGAQTIYDRNELELRLFLASRFPKVVRKSLVIIAIAMESAFLIFIPNVPWNDRKAMVSSRLSVLGTALLPSNRRGEGSD
jgi:glycosyltransferase involved in cell wall biosynthesis